MEVVGGQEFGPLALWKGMPAGLNVEVNLLFGSLQFPQYPKKIAIYQGHKARRRYISRDISA